MRKMWIWMVIAFVSAIVSGCSNLYQPGFNERDLYVANTPTEYPDNRVFYVGRIDGKTGATPVSSSWALTDEQKKNALVHGSPLSIIIDAVGLPISTEKRTKDIAVILDVHTDKTAEVRSIVVWYQRGVNPGQTLNFKNLLIHSQEQWDERIAPMFRIRVVDVVAERNEETRDSLAQVGKFGSALGALIQNPLTQPVIETATRAASLVLSNRSNKILMDYSIQFFSNRLVMAAGTPNLTPLLTGRFVLAGRSLKDLDDEMFWHRPATLDEYNTVVRFSKVDPNKLDIRSPGVSIQVLDRELIVPAQVASRSAYLTKLLTDTANVNLDEMVSISKVLANDVKSLGLREEIVRYRQVSAIGGLVEEMFGVETTGEKSMPETSRQVNARFLRKISGCLNLETESIKDWWDKKKSDVNFKSNDDFAKDTVATVDVLLKGVDLCQVK